MREGKKKTIRERHSGFHTPRLAKRVVWPQTAKFNQRGKSCVSFDFLKLLEDFQKDAPAKVPLCDAERMLESSGKQRIGDFPLRSEKLRQGKVATLAKKKKERFPMYKNTGSKCKCSAGKKYEKKPRRYEGKQIHIL